MVTKKIRDNDFDDGSNVVTMVTGKIRDNGFDDVVDVYDRGRTRWSR